MRNLKQPCVDGIDIAFDRLKFDRSFGFELLLFAFVAHLGEHELEGVDEFDVAQHVFLIHQLDELLKHFVFPLLA